MNVSKILIAALAVLWLSGQAVFGQWTTSGNDIYNTNSGNVGIGTMSPAQLLEVVGGNIRLTNTSSHIELLDSNTTGDGINTQVSYWDATAAKKGFVGFQDGNDLRVQNNYTDGSIDFRTKGANSRLFINATGYVGIGTTMPGADLHMVRDGAPANIYLQSYGKTMALIARAAGGSQASPTATPAQSLLNLGGRGHDGLGFTTNKARISLVAKQTFSTSSTPTYIRFETTASGSTTLTERMRIDDTGNVGIGTTNPTHTLTVNGDITTEEVVVVPDVPADFVFEDDYELMPLSEVKRYIDEHGHLPEIPSGAEMHAEGVGLSAMQMKLLQKIEELTLYLIEQQKENALLKERLIDLEAAGN